MTFRPLKAPSKPIPESHLPKLQFPLMASPKLDGLRVLARNGAKTSSLKPVRNIHTNKLISHPKLEGLDGEVAVGDGMDAKGFKLAISAVMATEGIYPITYWVFDIHDMPTIPFIERFTVVVNRIEQLRRQGIDYVRVVPHTRIHSMEELEEYEADIVGKGFEGVMLRDIEGRYKYDRSTLNEGILLKLKRGNMQRSDAIILGFVERMENTNEAFINERGLTERSRKREGLIGRNDLGAFLVKDVDTGIEFNIGGGDGLDDSLRKEVWDNKEKYLGQTIRYEHFAYGGYDKPRHPKFICFRPEE